jgi:hypothetical protein
MGRGNRRRPEVGYELHAVSNGDATGVHADILPPMRNWGRAGLEVNAPELSERP